MDEFVKVCGTAFDWNQGTAPDSVGFVLDALLTLGCTKKKQRKNERELLFEGRLVGKVRYLWNERFQDIEVYLDIEKVFLRDHREALIEQAVTSWSAAIVSDELYYSGVDQIPGYNRLSHVEDQARRCRTDLEGLFARADR